MNAVSKAPPRAGDENSLPDGSMIVTAEQLAVFGGGDVKRGRRELRLLISNEQDRAVKSGPTPRPANVRLAVPTDEEAIYALLLEDLEENAVDFALPDRERIIAHIQHATQKQGSLCGVIDGPDGKPAGVALLQSCQFWWTKSYHLFEIFLYVGQDYRRSNYVDDLLNWEKWAADEMTRGFGYRVPLVCGVLGARRIRAKINLYRRHFAQAGIACIYPSPFDGGWR